MPFLEGRNVGGTLEKTIETEFRWLPLARYTTLGALVHMYFVNGSMAIRERLGGYNHLGEQQGSLVGGTSVSSGRPGFCGRMVAARPTETLRFELGAGASDIVYSILYRKVGPLSALQQSDEILFLLGFSATLHLSSDFNKLCLLCLWCEFGCGK